MFAETTGVLPPSTVAIISILMSILVAGLLWWLGSRKARKQTAASESAQAPPEYLSAPPEPAVAAVLDMTALDPLRNTPEPTTEEVMSGLPLINWEAFEVECTYLIHDRLRELAQAIQRADKKLVPSVEAVDFSKISGFEITERVLWPTGCSGGLRVGAETFYSGSFTEKNCLQDLLTELNQEPSKILRFLQEAETATKRCIAAAEKREEQSRTRAYAQEVNRERARRLGPQEDKAVRELRRLMVTARLAGRGPGQES